MGRPIYVEITFRGSLVNNSVWGPLFGYNGWFDAEWINCKPGEVPSDVKPLREERRE